MFYIIDPCTLIRKLLFYCIFPQNKTTFGRGRQLSEENIFPSLHLGLVGVDFGVVAPSEPKEIGGRTAVLLPRKKFIRKRIK